MAIKLTSYKLATEGNCIVDTETGLCSHSEAILFLIEANVTYFIATSCSSRYCHYVCECVGFRGLLSVTLQESTFLS